MISVAGAKRLEDNITENITASWLIESAILKQGNFRKTENDKQCHGSGAVEVTGARINNFVGPVKSLDLPGRILGCCHLHN